MGVTAARLLAPLALVVSPLSAAVATDLTPAEIVAAAPESERSLRQSAALAAAQRSLDATASGARAVLDVAPEVTYGADIEDPAGLAPSLDLGLELGWRYDAAALRRDRADVLYQRERLRHWRRADARDALRLLGATLRAEVALQRAELDLARARRLADGVGARRAQALLDARRHALQRLRADAADLGFAGEARLEPAAFPLPPAPPAPPARARLALVAEAARLERDRAATFEVVRDVTFDAVYESRTDRFQLSASLSLDRGRPAASLGGEIGGQQDDQWRLGLSADIRVDSAAADARAAAEERVRRAEAEAAELEADYPRQLREARTGVEDARAALAAELAAWREERGRRRQENAPGAPRAGSAAGGADAGGTAAGGGRAGATLGRPTPAGRPSPSACRALLARENAVYGAWLDLVSAVYDYLEVVDGGWAVESPGMAPVEAPGVAGAGNAAAAAGADPTAIVDGLAGAWPARPSTCALGDADAPGG